MNKYFSFTNLLISVIIIILGCWLVSCSDDIEKDYRGYTYIMNKEDYWSYHKLIILEKKGDIQVVRANKKFLKYYEIGDTIR